MAKDPAILFYTNDFISGTLTMTDEQRGQYIILLCLQHQKGFLTEKDMLNICKRQDEDVWAKFEKEGDKFYNKRLREEAEKRRLYSESRRNNRIKKNKKGDSDKNICNTYVNHMENENLSLSFNNKKGVEKNYEDIFSNYRKHMSQVSVMERLGMNAGVKPKDMPMVMKEFLEVCYGDIMEKNNQYQVEQYFLQWVKKEGRVLESINNQLRKRKEKNGKIIQSS